MSLPSGKYRSLTFKERRAVFIELVRVQDIGMSEPESREAICRKFRIPGEQLRRIVDEALLADWPLPSLTE